MLNDKISYLTLMYITNDPSVAIIAQAAGIDRIWIDMEYIGKIDRQGGLNTVQNHHTIADIRRIKPYLTTSKLQVRINPVHEGSEYEINEAISAGAEYIMLPYFKSAEEVRKFLDFVKGRAKTMILLETKEAVDNIDEIINIEGIDEVHIGLNDLHLSYGKTFMFELLTDGTVDKICKKLQMKGIRYGFGGIARIGSGILPAEVVVGEHYRLASSMVILARAFCDTSSVELDMNEVEEQFIGGVRDLRNYEDMLKAVDDNFFFKNHKVAEDCINKVVKQIKSSK